MENGKVELFGWVAELVLINGQWQAKLPKVEWINESTSACFRMFIGYVEWHLKELNNA